MVTKILITQTVDVMYTEKKSEAYASNFLNCLNF